MIVRFGSVEEFCSEVAADAASVREGVVRVEIAENPEQAECVTYQVCFAASAVIVGEDNLLALYQFADIGGTDTVDDKQGSRKADEWLRKVEEMADDCGLRVRRGHVELI